MDVLKHRVMKEELKGDFARSEKTWRVFLDVDRVPSQTDLANAAESIWRNGNTLWARFSLYFYLPGMDIAAAAFCIAEFDHGGMTRIAVQESALRGTEWELRPEGPGAAETKEYALELDLEHVVGRSLRISVEASLPDSTNLLLTLGRSYVEWGKDAADTAVLHVERFAIVGGSVRKVVGVDDSRWFLDRVARQKSADPGRRFAGFKSISPMIIATVRYSPLVGQPSRVVTILGDKGQFVAGRGAETVEAVTTLSVSKEVEMHLQR
jgi:hypothetical protein